MLLYVLMVQSLPNKWGQWRYWHPPLFQSKFCPRRVEAVSWTALLNKMLIYHFWIMTSRIYALLPIFVVFHLWIRISLYFIQLWLKNCIRISQFDETDKPKPVHQHANCLWMTTLARSHTKHPNMATEYYAPQSTQTNKTHPHGKKVVDTTQPRSSYLTNPNFMGTKSLTPAQETYEIFVCRSWNKDEEPAYWKR